MSVKILIICFHFPYPGNFFYTFDPFELFDQVIQPLGIVDIQHNKAFKSSMMCIEMDISDVHIIFAADGVSYSFKKTKFINSYDPDP